MLYGDRIVVFGRIEVPSFLAENEPLARQILQVHRLGRFAVASADWPARWSCATRSLRPTRRSPCSRPAERC
jgi:hypothetical protein